MADSTAIVTGKRKRQAVNYATLGQLNDQEFEEAIGYEAFTDDDDVEEGMSDDDGGYGSRRKKSMKTRSHKKRWTKPRAPKPQKPFPFLALPAELRDYIYELALVDPAGMTISFRAKARRRTISRVYHDGYRGGYRAWNRRNIPAVSIKDRAVLSPNLLATNKQIYAEAIGYLYKQKFTVSDTMALHTFIATISPFNRSQLSEIVLKSWGGGRGVYKAMNFASLTLLAGCTELHSLTFDCELVWRLDVVRFARTVYRNGHFFLEGYAAKHGKEAAVNVIKVGEDAIPSYWQQQDGEKCEKFESDVRGELRKLLKM